jgi:hypothetical protein
MIVELMFASFIWQSYISLKGKRNPEDFYIMTKTLRNLYEEMTPEEQSELEAFALFMIARRKFRKQQILTNDISIEELMNLVEKSGSFDWLKSPEEDVYSLGAQHKLHKSPGDESPG